MLEEELTEALVKRTIYHLYSLVCKTGKIRIPEIFETPLACRTNYCYVLLEEEFIEASVERSIYYLYSLVYKTGKIRNSIGYMNHMF